MNGRFLTKPWTLAAASALLAIAASPAYAADLGGVTVVPDRDVNARTNMTRTPWDTSTLGVTYDPDIAKRTNMQRQPDDVVPVTVIKDSAVMERTNMGGTARAKHLGQPAQEAASNQPISPFNPVR